MATTSRRSSCLDWIASVALFLLAASPPTSTALEFDTNAVGSNELGPDVIQLRDRTYIPYGPNRHTEPLQEASEQPWTGYGLGTGTAEVFVFDDLEHYLYSKSNVGHYITIMDYKTFPPSVSEYSFELVEYDGRIVDMEICPGQELLFLLIDGTEKDELVILDTVKRSNPATPVIRHAVGVGNDPQYMAINHACTRLAVSNRNTPAQIRNDHGSVHLVTDFGSSAPNVTSVTFRGFTDEELVDADVHLPADENSLRYWQSRFGNTAFFDSALQAYDPAMILWPGRMVFTHDDSELHVNLPENSALIRVNPHTARVINAEGYGLKSFRAEDGPGMDLEKLPHEGCKSYDAKGSFMTNQCLRVLRSPDDIVSVRVDGANFLLTAEEGSSNTDRDAFGERVQAGAIFEGNMWGLANFSSSLELFEVNKPTVGCAANFNKECQPASVPGGWCAPEFEVSVGTAAVDYSDPQAPILNRIVGFGGRGVGVYEIGVEPNQPSVLVWDSKSEMEIETCKYFPWAQNAVTDDTFVTPKDPAYDFFPINRGQYDAQNSIALLGCRYSATEGSGPCPMGETTGRKALADGLAPGAMVAGVACDRLVTVACAIANALCFVYDISTIKEPVLKKVFSLSPLSENGYPEALYMKEELGDITPDTLVFVERDNSPSGKEGILIGGSTTGSVAFYEFVCERDAPRVNTPKPTFAPLKPTAPEPAPVSSPKPVGGASGVSRGSSDSEFEKGAIVGVAFGLLIGVVMLGCACVAFSFIGRPGKLSPTEDPTAMAEIPADGFSDTSSNPMTASSEAPAEIVPESSAQEAAHMAPPAVEDSPDGRMMDVAIQEDRMV